MNNIEENQSSSNKGSFTLLDYIKVFSNNKKPILITSLITCIITVIVVFFIMDLIYLSTGVVKTTSESSGLGGLLSTTGLPDLSEFGGLTQGGTSQELALYENILISRRCIEETIYKFNLMEEYNHKKMFFALKDFRENVMEISKDKTAGTISIGVYDKDPVRAKEIADFLIYQLNKINVELNVQNARNNREYIEKRYEIVEKELKQVEDSLINYQNTFGIAPDIQVQAAVKTEVELEAEIRSEEVKLDLLRKILSPDQAEIKAQEEKINALNKQLFDIQNSTDRTSVLKLKGSPDIVMNFLRLKREVEIQTKILTFIIPMLEQAKIEEKKETPTILILDPPQVPDHKTKPKRLTLTILSILIFTFLAYLFFFIKTKVYIRNEDDKAKLKR